MTRHLNISPLHRRDHARATTPRGTCTAAEGLDAETFRGFQLAGELFLLTSFFIEPKLQPSQESVRKVTPSAAGAPFRACAITAVPVRRGTLLPVSGQYWGCCLGRTQPRDQENSKRINLAPRLGFEPRTLWLTTRSEMIALLALSCASDLPFHAPRAMNVFTTGSGRNTNMQMETKFLRLRTPVELG